jgi:DNA replication protein DnaC
MEEQVKFKRLLQEVQERKVWQSIDRAKKDIDINQCLEFIEEIGKTRTPNFVIDEDNRFVYENFVKWLTYDETLKALDPNTNEIINGDCHKGIYIAGYTGTGKSWCMEIMLAFASAIKFNIKFGNNVGGMWWKIVRADDIVSHFIETTSIEEFKRYKILCIQDFGTEPLEAVSMGNRLNVIRTLLESRGDDNSCLTLITSNIPINHNGITEKYGERVASRLYQMCNYYELKGQDRRIK